MSSILKCDMCGKTAEGKAKFTDETLKLQLPTFDNSNLNFFISIKVEDNDDIEILSKFQDQMAEMGIYGLEDFEEMDNDTIQIVKTLEFEAAKKLKNNNPHLCNDCKREVLKLALNYGSYNKLPNPIKD
jgi:major membrane immunogen (membrane-anchored lipoprotein)